MIIGGIVVVLFIAVLALPLLVDVNKYHDKIQTELSSKLKRPVTLGQLRLKVFPLRVRVDNAVIGEDPQFQSGRPFATADELDVSAKLLPLLRKDIQIKSVELVQPKIELIRDPQGNWNFSSLASASPSPNSPSSNAGATVTTGPAGTTRSQRHLPSANQGRPAPQAAAPKPAPSSSSPGPSGGDFSLAELKITDGQVAITDNQKHQSRSVYDHIDLTLNDFAPRRPFTMSLAAHLPGQGKQLLQIEAKAGPLQQGNMITTPLDGTIKLNQVSLSGLQNFLNSQALAQMDAVASGEAALKNENGRLASNGTVRLENVRLNGTEVGYPISADYDVSDDLATDLIHIAKADIKLGPTPISIAGDVNTHPTPAQMDLKVTAQNASLSELARLAAAMKVAFAPGMQVAGTLNANIHASGPANQPALDGTLSARNLEVSGKELPQAVKVPAIELTMSPDVLRSNQFTVQSANTALLMNVMLSQYSKPNGTVDASIRTSNAELGEFINIAKAYGVAALQGVTASGALSLNARVQGPIKHTDALTYSGNGSLRNAVINTPSLTKPLQVRNASMNFAQNAVTLQNVALSLGETNANGNVTVRNFAAPQLQFTLTADKVNVAELEQITKSAPAPAQRAANRNFDVVLAAEAAVPAKNEPGALSKMTGAGSISAGSVQYNDLLLTDVRSNVNLDHGLIKLAPLTAQLFGGQENGAITVDTRPANPVYSINSSLQKVDSNKLLSATTSLKQVLYGLLAANASTTFTSVPGGDIARTLNGTASIDLQNGKLANVDLLKEIASVGKFLQIGRSSQNFTNLVQMAGTLAIHNGVASTNNLKAVIDGGTLAADGLMNLVDQTLNMHLTAVLNKDYSQKVGGSQIGGFMNTALANNRGELVVPVIVTGTFAHPSFAPDVQKIAQMKINNLLPTSANPGQLTSGVLGSLLGKNGQSSGGQGGLQGVLGALSGKQQNNNAPTTDNNNAAQPQQQSPQGAIGDLLNRLGKKKQQQPAPPVQEPPK